MIDLFSHMNAGIRTLMLDALKVSARQPKQLLFLRSFLGSLGRAQSARGEHEARGLHVPPFLIASITSSCNLACAGCYSRANQDYACAGHGMGVPLDAARWEALFREAGELGVCFVLLAGGEPMLRTDVLQAAARHPEIIFPVFTNGSLLDGRALDFFNDHRNLIPVVSLEGGREATDGRRGEGVYDRIMDAMGAMKARGIFFGCSITVTRANLAGVTDLAFAKDLRKRGCSLAFYVEYVPSDQVSRDLAPTAEDRAILEERVRALKQAVRMLVISFPGDEKETGGCLAAGRGFVHVNADGRVEPCPFSPYSDTNLRDITLAQALDSPFLRRMRADDFLLGEHDGGCLLFDKQDAVRAMLKDCETT